MSASVSVDHAQVVPTLADGARGSTYRTYNASKAGPCAEILHMVTQCCAVPYKSGVDRLSAEQSEHWRLCWHRRSAIPTIDHSWSLRFTSSAELLPRAIA